MANSENKEQTANNSGSSTQEPARPVYRKPVIRKYDQIEQVKPYGPSEKQAG
jgi:hypothetical protein